MSSLRTDPAVIYGRFVGGAAVVAILVFLLAVELGAFREAKEKPKEPTLAETLETGAYMLRAQRDLIASLEVQLQLVQEERDAWKKLSEELARKVPGTNDGWWGGPKPR